MDGHMVTTGRRPRGRLPEEAHELDAPQRVPVKLYRTPDRVTVAAPMPGLLPDDLVVSRARSLTGPRSSLGRSAHATSGGRDLSAVRAHGQDRQTHAAPF